MDIYIYIIFGMCFREIIRVQRICDVFGEKISVQTSRIYGHWIGEEDKGSLVN